VPLVATTLGASGSAAAQGEHALVADDARAFAAALVTLLRRPDERARLAGAARQLAEARHDWRQITPRLLEVYDRLAAPRFRVSVITTLLNERETAGRLLTSLAGQQRRPDEVVVVDGGSRDGTPGVVEESAAAACLPLRLIRAPGANISQGRNRAVREAASEVIAATDGGVELHPAWLQRLAWPLDRDPSLQAVSGFFVAAPRTTWELALGATTLPEAEEIDPTRFLPSSRSVAFRRGAWEAAGRYPEWLDYCEDLLFDFGLRERCGPVRFQPRAVVRFRPRSSPWAFFKQYYCYARGDGKAGLWPGRHAIRYGTYLAGAALAGHALAGRGPRWTRRFAALFLVGGVVIYVRRPLIRLAHQSGSVSAFGRAAPLAPLIRVIGDVAKMLGYPPGALWRLRHRVRCGCWPEQS
jgi:glycosyltransferase involved in cell wall biosynthesis